MKKTLRLILLLTAVLVFAVSVSAKRLYADVTSNLTYAPTSPPRLMQDGLPQSAFLMDPALKPSGEHMQLLLDYGHPYLIEAIEISFASGAGKEDMLFEYYDGKAWHTLKSGAFADAVSLPNLYIMAEQLRLTSRKDVIIGINEIYVNSDFKTEVGYRKPVSYNSAYVKKDETWHPENLTDGHLEYGFSTNPYDRNLDPNRAYHVTVDLGKEYALSQVLLYNKEMKMLPVAFDVQVSSDNVSYRTVGTVRDLHGYAGSGIGVCLKGEKGRFVRVLNKQMREATPDGYLMQFAEMKIFRADTENEGTIRLASENISINEGKTYMLVPHYTYPDEDVTYTYRSENEAIAIVDPDGLVRAISPGTVTVYIKDSIRGTEKPVYVTVKNREFLYMAFYPPMPGYQTKEQYAYMKEAGMNSVLMGSWSHVTPQFAMESLEAAKANGIGFYAADSRVENILNMSDLQIRTLVSEYKNHENVIGYYLKDEPIGANPYARAYKIMADEDPDAVPHLNFYPVGAIEHFGYTYEGYIDDWVALLGPEYKHKISFDNYPFNNDVYNESATMFHMDLFHKYARKHDIDFEYYVQSVDLKNGFYANDNSVRYHFSVGLAYGAKSFQYFTWFTPQGTGESFVSGSAIMTENGQKGELFDITKKTNEAARKVEPYLAPSEAVCVYHVGSLGGNETHLPGDFFFRVTNNQNAIVTLFENEAKKENYILVVNKNYSAASSHYDFMVEGASAVYDITSGSPVAVSMDGNTFSADIEGGFYRLYAFNDGFYYEVKEETYEDKALNKPVYVSTSHGIHGLYAKNVTDGDAASAWEPTENDSAPYALIDLKQDETIGYITLKADENYAGSAKVYVSRDNAYFEPVSGNVSLTSQGVAISFDRRKVRYIRVELTSNRMRISELCAYERNPIRISYQANYIENGMASLNTAGDFSDLKVISAIYENGKMTGIRILTEADLKAGTTELFPVVDSNNTIVKTFLIKDSVATLMPYSGTVDFDKGKLHTVMENFDYGYDGTFWTHAANGSSSYNTGKLSGFAFSFGNKVPLNAAGGYTLSADVYAPKDPADGNIWMSAGVALRANMNAAPYSLSNGIMLLLRGNELGLRTQINGSAWNQMFASGQQMMTIPVSFATERKLIIEDNGSDEIKISATGDNGETIVLGYVVISASGATLYDAAKATAYGTLASGSYGDNYVSVFQHVGGTTFDNISLTYRK